MRPARFIAETRRRLDGLHAWLSPLGLRLLLAWEYFESGREKLHGDNWFADIQSAFPFPFDRIPPALSWPLATWLELLGGVALLLGFATRATAAALFALTVVAIAAVHWPPEWHTLGELARGYAITDAGYGNYKLPLLFLAMLVPLMLGGGGPLSIDALVARRLPATVPLADARAWGLCLIAGGAVAAWLLPLFGTVLAACGVALLGMPRLPRPV
ncbi:MAG TPA: DoxX family membrane protein [Lysobacter sp.]|nr:DoxX family membrane protein [Lysobacter sp.]